MKNLFLSLILLPVLFSCMKEDDPSEIIEKNGFITLESLSSQSVAGNIADGEQLSTLEWAWSSANACFVEPAASRFQGNHVFYQIELPTNSIITIKLIPDDASDALGLYAYSKASGDVTFPEDLNSAVTCEADPSNNNGSQTGSREVELNAISNPYSVMIGVAGASEVNTGAFTLEVKIES